MPSNGYFMYIYENRLYIEKSRHGGLSIPPRLACGEEWHFQMMCEGSELIDSAWSTRDLSLGVKDYEGFLWSNYGGFIVNFDNCSIILSVYVWDISDSQTKDLDIKHFNRRPGLRKCLTKVMAEFWPSWNISWTDEEDLEDFILGRTTYATIPILDDLGLGTDDFLPSTEIEVGRIYRDELILML